MDAAQRVKSTRSERYALTVAGAAAVSDAKKPSDVPAHGTRVPGQRRPRTVILRLRRRSSPRPRRARRRTRSLRTNRRSAATSPRTSRSWSERRDLVELHPRGEDDLAKRAGRSDQHVEDRDARRIQVEVDGVTPTRWTVPHGFGRGCARRARWPRARPRRRVPASRRRRGGRGSRRMRRTWGDRARRARARLEPAPRQPSASNLRWIATRRRPPHRPSRR